jgi:carbonic anhydrase
MIDSAKEVLDMLLEGNRRFAGSLLSHPHQDAARRTECVAGQHPVAAVLGCADSRVPPEVLFDCGIGDLFIVRNAGTVIDETSVASLEYAVDHLKVPLVMVLGHTSCGAVTAAVMGVEAPGALGRLLDGIRGECTGVERKDLSGAAINNVIEEYTVRMSRQLISGSAAIGNALQSRTCEVAAACYSLENGVVTVL